MERHPSANIYRGPIAPAAKHPNSTSVQRTSNRAHVRLDQWRTTRGKADPDSLFAFDLARRLELIAGS
ncbi:MAG TPA: hypothetical protein VE197_19675 [Mycobacterium sp.]|nr:hypothetical protein [Mycobacterium sp.]